MPSHQQHMRVPAPPLHHSVKSVFQILDILIDVEYYLVVLICISPMTYDVEGLFICHLYIFFSEVFGKIFNLCFNQVDFLMLSFKSYLYIWGNSSLSDASLQYLLPVACLLILLMMSFTEQSFSFWWSPGCQLFIVLHFIFRSIMHFVLLFVRGVRSVFRFLFVLYRCTVVSAPFTERTIFPPLYCFSLSNASWFMLEKSKVS